MGIQHLLKLKSVEICLRPTPSTCYSADRSSGARTVCRSDPSLLRRTCSCLWPGVTGADRWRQLTGSPAVVGSQNLPRLTFYCIRAVILKELKRNIEKDPFCGQ